MAEGTVEFDKARLSTRCIESVNDVARLGGGLEPVSVKADNAESRLCLREGCGKAPAVIFRKIEINHGAVDVEIAVCIKTIDEADPLIPPIASPRTISLHATAFPTPAHKHTHTPS